MVRRKADKRIDADTLHKKLAAILDNPRMDSGINLREDTAKEEDTTMTAIMRLATAEDAAKVLAIYAPIVRETAISFEYEVPDEGEIRKRIVSKLEHHPWLVMEDGDRMLGYAYAGRWRDRAAYDWTVETTIYVSADARRSGIGRKLYHALFAALRLQGFVEAVAGATLPNEGSVGLHRAVGFRDMGVKRNAGYKFGRWYDVAFFERSLQPAPASPAPTKSVYELINTPAWQALLNR